MRQRWDIYSTPDEAKLYAALQDDNYLKSLDPKAALAIYYSLLNWKCVGKIDPKLDPGPVSPQSLAGRYSDESQVWLEFWESNLRDRLWMVRSDLRQIRLPDGRLETGLRPPTDLAAMRPACTSTAGKWAVITARRPSPRWQRSLFRCNWQWRFQTPCWGCATSFGVSDYPVRFKTRSWASLAPWTRHWKRKALGQTKSPTGVVGGAGGFPWWLVAGAAAIALS
jgi:hypothetical protein